MIARDVKIISISVIVIFLLIIPTNCFVMIPQVSGDNSNSRGISRGVVGPKNLLNNSDFSKISDWRLIDAIVGEERVIFVTYDNKSSPSFIHFLRLGQIYGAPFLLNSCIKQNFTKSIWTSDYPTAVTCSLDYNMTVYIGLLDFEHIIYLEFWVEIKNKSSPSTIGEWPIAAGTTGPQPKFKTNDGFCTTSRIGVQQHITLNISGKQGAFTIGPPGAYEFAIKVRLSCISSGSNILSAFELRFDNVTLNINDIYEPLVVPNEQFYGPYNSDPGGLIDVDFLTGGKENTSLREGKFRLNNSGTPGSWNSIFKNQNNYTQNWSLTTIWSLLDEGENTIDLYCTDDVGNYNDSMKITVLKDTMPPNSQASELDDYHTQQEFDINYTASDTLPSGGYDNIVELWFRYNETGEYKQYKPSWCTNGLFNRSPIKFNLTEAGTGLGDGKYEFYTIAVDNASNRENIPSAAEGPDTSTILDCITPESEAWGVLSEIGYKTFDVKFNASDAGSGIDYVELWYLLNGNWYQWNGSYGYNGKFPISPILFTAEHDGIYGFKTVAYDKIGNIEKGGRPNPNNIPPTEPDIITLVDAVGPTPIFTKPTKLRIRGEETINVISDPDTKEVEFYYWIDSNKDGIANSNDIGSSWKLINTILNPTNGYNWSTTWDTTDSANFPEFQDTERLVILKAIGSDKWDHRGEGLMNNLEVDNIAPTVTIHEPEINYKECDGVMTISYELDCYDGNYTRFYWSYIEENNWNLITGEGLVNGIFQHPSGEKKGSYEWEIPSTLRLQSPIINLKVEVIDDVENIGSAVIGPLNINRLCPPKIKADFPTIIDLPEDFGVYKLVLTTFEEHSTPEYTGDELKWYVTGNSGTIFSLTGDNSTGANADTFIFTSISDKFGTEELTYHLIDPAGMEDTIIQTVNIEPVNDPPILDLPPGTFQIAHSKKVTIDFSVYISDIDNELSELTITADDIEHISSNGLSLNFNYPASMENKTKEIKITVSDGIDITTKMVNILITANSQPIWIIKFPHDLTIKEDQIIKDYLDLDNFFSDPDGDILNYSYTSEKIMVTISKENKITLQPKPNTDGVEKVWFRARDPYGAFADGYMIITIIGIPEPPIIKPIPDLCIRHNTDKGVSYDFSYFIYDPDNEHSELTIWANTILEEDKDTWITSDPENNMRLIFKFPKEAAGETHPLALYVSDPDNQRTYRFFNITIVIDQWPVEQIAPIPDQSFYENEVLENAFRLDINESKYFSDPDGGTTFEILENDYIKAEIDEENYVDLSTKIKDWNTGDSYVELIIVAKDTNPPHYVYAIVRVYVLPVPIQLLLPLPELSTTLGEVKTFNITNYLNIVDFPLSEISIETEDPTHVSVNGTQLIIKFDKEGKYTIKVWFLQPNGSKSNTQNLIINVTSPPKTEPDKTRETDDTLFYMEIGIGVIIAIVIILVLLFLLLRRRKTVTPVYNNQQTNFQKQQSVPPTK